MRSIRTKLVTYFTVLILLAAIAIGLISIKEAKESLTQEAERNLIALAAGVAGLTESRIETQVRTLEMIAMNQAIQSMDWEQQQPILARVLPNTNFLDIGVVLPDGTAYYTDGTVSQLGDREYVKKALNGETNVSDLIISRVTNELVLMYATPIKRDGRIVGALIGRHDGNSLSDLTNDIKFGDHGYAYMINGQGTVIAHPDQEQVFNQFNPIVEVQADQSLSSVATLFEQMLVEKAGADAYTFEGQDLYAGYAPVEGTDWIMIVTADLDEVLSAVPGLVRNILLVVVGGLVVSMALILILGHSLANPIVRMAEKAEAIARLDLTQEVPAVDLRRKDEIGILAKSLNSIIGSLREVIQVIGNSSEQVAVASEQLTAASQTAAGSAAEVAKTMEEIAKGAAQQAGDTENGAAKGMLVGELVETEQKDVQAVNVATNRIAEIIEEGLREIEKLYQITEESNRAAKSIVDVIIKTNESSNKIGEASNVISSIADQTNLLALNAAIEAARAGEAGKGFAVVAEEIRKLAEQSSASTKAIDEIVVELQNNAQDAVKTMEKVNPITELQAEVASNNKNKYMEIAGAIKDVEKAVEELNASTDKLEQTKNEIVNTLQNLSAIAEENSAATEEVMASMEEQSASIQQIASSSESLAELTQNLRSVIMKFKI
ncbi:MAG: methyl-accepting chemotaxis protein [Clostridia bacterium]|nr:methyl-accepting chemotaxis protein [Clostridia bacterium]